MEIEARNLRQGSREHRAAARFKGDNKGLTLAEIELQSENQHFEIPEWIGEEVSGDPRYFNSNLVKHPFTKW